MDFKAAVLRRWRAPLSIETISARPLGPHDVLVRVHAAGVCHTDWEATTGVFPLPLPVVLGHEGSGVVEAIGTDVSLVKRGDHVVLSIYPNCGHCYHCRREQPMLCEDVVAGHRDGCLPTGEMMLRDEEGPIGHFLATASFAEYCIVPEQGAVPVPAELPFDRACLLGCSVLTGVGAVVRIAKVMFGDSLVVVGCGPVGLNVLQGARMAGAQAIIAIDKRSDKLARARAFGATHTILANPDAPAQVRAVTGGRGADHAVEAAGIFGALQLALDCSRPGGSVTILGKTNPDASIPLRFGSLMGERRIVRPSAGGAKAADDYPALARAYLDGRLLLDELISVRLPLADINDAMDAVAKGDVIRAVIELNR